jgi:hypothetical protein
MDRAYFFSPFATCSGSNFDCLGEGKTAEFPIRQIHDERFFPDEPFQGRLDRFAFWFRVGLPLASSAMLWVALIKLTQIVL